MGKIKPWLKRHCTANSIGLIFTIFSLISSIITIIYFTLALISQQQYGYVYNYQSSNCLPIAGYAQSLNCHDTSKWISVLRDSSGRTIVENPFALRSSRQDAIDDRYRSDLGNNRSCLCLDSINTKSLNLTVRECSVWPQCILDTDFLTYIQMAHQRSTDTYISFIVASLVSVILSLIGMPSTIIIIIQRYKFHDREYIGLF